MVYVRLGFTTLIAIAACGDSASPNVIDALKDADGDTSDAPIGPGCENALVCEPNPGTTSLWDVELASTMAVVPIDAAITPSGGVVVVGEFTGDLMLGGTPHAAAGGFDGFVAKLDPMTGTVIWGKVIATTGDDLPASVVVDSCGNVYVSGSFGGPVDFGGGSRTITGLTDGFVVAYTPAGAFRWAKQVAGSAASTGDRVTGIAIDTADQLTIAARFGGTLDLGLGPNRGTANAATVVARLASDTGTATWNTVFRSTTSIEPLGVTVDAAGEATVVGRFTGTVDFGGGGRQSVAASDAYAAHVDTTGAWKHDIVWGGTSSDQANAAAAAGNLLVIAGQYRDSIMLDGQMLTATGVGDGLVVGVSETGTIEWDRAWVGNGADFPLAITATTANDFVAAGTSFAGTIDFGGGSHVTSSGSSCPTVGYTSAGTYAWERTFGGDGGSCSALGIGAGRCGRLAVVGQFQNSVDFGGGVRTSTGVADGFILMLEHL